ncbi:MAG: GNAT family N-acetyltransferase [Bacteroidetes bacterium]|nr:MAG: GNAT family N-acetyltransferase [Bacteroidota bacterium]TAG87656.1 MAG: GNAT family N-acetyltransferase [Bacteroidota bacterium]
MINFDIKKIEKKHIPDLLRLIKELAEYEKAPQEVTNTTQKMLEDGFGENPIFGGYVAEIDNKIVGMAIYYYRYSTWKGRVLYLEDLYIMPEYRRLGIGEAFFDVLIQYAKNTNCARITWQVLDWNTPAIKFYEKLGAKIDKGWWNGFMDL